MDAHLDHRPDLGKQPCRYGPGWLVSWAWASLLNDAAVQSTGGALHSTLQHHRTFYY
uniref:Uncharacterized protein n=1 Tax=Arundo donax TaxID=35708 RepID=A0A0A9F379_ARUDO